MEKRNNKDIRYFVDTTGEMLISIDGKNSLIIDLDGEISYVYDINKTLPLFDRCLSEINKSTLSDKFIGKMMCAATENEQGSSENKEISRAAYLITKDLIDCKSGQKWYSEKLPRSVKISVCERLEKLRLDIKNIVDEANNKACVITDNIVNECMREWVSRVDDTLYVLGSVMGPHPFPMIVRDFQSVISREARAQILEKEGKLPDVVMACVGGGSNSMGMFYEFINDENVRLIGCEAAGHGVDTDKTAATMATGTEGIFHGMKSYFCQDEYGQIAPVYSVSAGLDYPGVGPEHAYLKDIGRAEYVPVTDDEAVEAFEYIARQEGIIAAIESSHAVAHIMKIAPEMDKDQIIICCLSGRGDKDVAAIARYRGVDLHE